eukprot:3435600-Rhodomonas_salina.3
MLADHAHATGMRCLGLPCNTCTMRSPVLTYAMLLPPCYAEPSTDLSSAATSQDTYQLRRRRARYPPYRPT